MLQHNVSFAVYLQVIILLLFKYNTRNETLNTKTEI